MKPNRHLFLFSISALALAWTACSAPSGSDGPPPMQITSYDAKTFFETTTYFGASFSSDEQRLLLSSDSSGIFNVYSQPFAGGEAERLTDSTTDARFAVSWFPSDDRFLFSGDEGGNELNHLYVRESDGTVKDLTPGEKVRAGFLGWSGDRTHFWVQTNERDDRFSDVYRYSATDYKRELVFQNNDAWSIGPISRDGRWIALGRTLTNADSDIFLWDARSPKKPPKQVTPGEGEISHAAYVFTPDSKQLVYATNEHGEFTQAWTYDVASGERKVLIEADWDVLFVGYSETGRYRVSAVNDDGRTVLTILDTSSGQPLALPELPEGELIGANFSRSETKLAFYINSDTSPSNLHVVELEGGAHRQLTRSLNPAIDQAHLVEATVERYKSFDDLEVPGILYKPHQAAASSKVPALVWVHGGPGGQSRRGYNAAIQHLVNHGYAVFAVNNRGSSGYGKTFFHMDDRKHGDVDLKDCIWARRYLESLDWVDGSKVGIIGGSYGGYMVAAALAFEPEAFDVGIDIFGVTNWLRTLKSMPAWWGPQRDAIYAELGDPFEEEERLRRISPLFHASNIVKPLLVVQGANDPRVLQAESDELVAAVESNGVPVEYVLFPDEGHGFRNRVNRITASDKYVEFLSKHLKGEATPSTD